jgi:hypothetical protein
MIEINLLPEELRKKETVKISLPMPDKKTVMLAVSAFFGLQVILIGLTMIQRMELSLVKAEVAKLQASGKELSAQKNEIATMKERMKQIRSLTQRKYYWASLLDAFTHSMTKGVWLRSIGVAEDAAPKKGAAAAVKNKESAKPAPVKKENKKAAAAKKPAGKNAKPEAAVETPAASTKSLKIEGSVVAPGHETAYIGRFIKSLKENPMMNTVFTDVELAGMNQKKIKEYDIYDFTLMCHYKREKA